MIITFEGAPAVGKSTVASELQNQYSCYTVAEANELFANETRESDLWYYQKQVQRWQLAQQNSEDDTLAVLDGDTFQPLWFGPCFPDEDWGNFDMIARFYQNMLETRQIQFPDQYIFFYIDEPIRAKRELQRGKALGRSRPSIVTKTERYSNFAVLQKEYFTALKDEFPELVIMLESRDIASSAQSIISNAARQHYDSNDIFQYIVAWCKNKMP